ncbi:uncharacterized protein LOC102203574 isoform X1 [Pundamilia nyererei]|uniref:Uncharacterized protein LOC102203574 isoform X1 n=2 Tax=Pundamilia nyererei TaxID=303518 RepID=A0A9Y6JJF0_9CICH|nr:PREDICTED: uncharacterized protein LOC102203574 isoform X1 [Pundamilia nyererei]
MLTRSCLIFPILFFTGKSLACHQINASCADIKTLAGFTFKHGSLPEGSKIYVYDNGTSIGHAELRNPPSIRLSSEVVHMDNNSVTTVKCRDITIQSIVPDGLWKGKPVVKEHCTYFKIIADVTAPIKTDPNESQALPTLIYYIFPAILGIIIIIIGIGLLLHNWKAHLEQQHSEASVSGFIMYLLTCLQKTGEGQETRAPPGQRIDNEQGTALECVVVQSTEADVNTPQSPSVDRNLSTERIQLTKNGDISTHNVSRISHHRSMNRNFKKEPGGVNSDKGQNISELDTGGAAGNRAEHDETEGQPLLTSKRFDMTGEAGPLANKAGFDRDGVNRCSAVPNTDVESQEIQEVGTGSNQ